MNQLYPKGGVPPWMTVGLLEKNTRLIEEKLV